MKICQICNKKIDRHSSKAIYCSSQCKDKAYKLRNPEKVKETQRKYNEKNHIKRQETWKKYRIKTGRSKTIYEEGMKNNCSECGKVFTPSKFHPYQKFCCLLCGSRFTQREWKNKNPDRVKEIMRKYDMSSKGKARRLRRIDKIKQYQKEWLKKHPEKTAEYSKAFRLKDPERVKKIRKKYSHTVKGILANRKKSHLKRMLVKRNYNHNTLIPILAEQNNKCPLCNADYGKNIENMELGHIFPLSKYNTIAGDTANILPICKKCNRKMHDSLFHEYCMKNYLPIPDRVIRYINKQKLLLDFL